MIRSTIAAAICLFLTATSRAADWKPLFNGKNLDGWEPIGECIWTVTAEGNLLGRRPPPTGKEPFGPWPVSQKDYRSWQTEQAWLYTTRDYRSHDLHVEYWLYKGGNSGISLFDTSHGRTSFGPRTIKTPAHIGYEIQILGTDEGQYTTGAIYTIQPAKLGLQKEEAWNTMDVETRPDMIRVKINGQVAAEHSPDPARPTAGPIGLQLHDRFSWVMFRNIRIREMQR